MEQNLSNFQTGSRPVWRNFMILIGFILIGMSVGNGLSIFLIKIIAMSLGGDFSILQVNELLNDPKKIENGWYYLMVLQGITQLCTFILPGLLYWYKIERRSVNSLCPKPVSNSVLFFFIILLVVGFMPMDSLIIELNQAMKLPAVLSEVETWMKNKELQLEKLTLFLTDFSTMGQFLVAFLVIAIIPAIGEELLFRGILQQKIMEKIGNPHVAIWASAAIFSAIHLQFYGFLPRLLLGAMFGYLYYWAGNLWIPIFAHLVNNGFTVTMLYLNKINIINFDIDKPESIPVSGAILSLILTVGLISKIRRLSLC